MSLLLDKNDIPLLIKTFLDEKNSDQSIKHITDEVMKSISFDGEHIDIPTDIGQLAKDVLFIINKFY